MAQKWAFLSYDKTVFKHSFKEIKNNMFSKNNC